MLNIFMVLGILVILFFIGLPFVLLYRWIYSSKKRKSHTIIEKELSFRTDYKTVNEQQQNTYKFMDDYRMWRNLNPEEKQIRLTDIEVIFNEGKDLIKREMIRKGFPPGSKIIDITYFTGLNEFGFTIATFLIQHESGGEIRALTFNIDLAKMNIRATNNHFYSTGKERYHYLKKEKGLMNI